MVIARASSVEQRRAIHGSLRARNRIIAILRIGVPALGAIMLLGLVGQIVIAGLVRDFGISRISVTSEQITIETPRYSGTMADGTRYVVSSDAASAALDDPGLINLSNALVALDRVTLADMTLRAGEAKFESLDQHVMVDGLAEVEDSTGTRGTLVGMFIDWPRQIVKASGAVHFDYASGMTIDATGLSFDPKTSSWSFGQATVIMPYTPGEAPGEAAGGQ